MKKFFTGVLSCMMLSTVFVCTQAFADNSGTRKTVYKYRYNNVPLKQPTVTKSMKSAAEEYNKGNYVGAMMDLKKVVEEEENNTYAKYYLALCYTQLGYKSEAQKLYQEIIEKGNSYPLTYYSQKATTCIEHPDSEICKPMKKIQAPDFTKYAKHDDSVSESESAKGEGQNTEEIDDMTKFIQSGKKIHPAAMDKISRERSERKLQADMYSKQQAEMEAQNQEN